MSREKRQKSDLLAQGSFAFRLRERGDDVSERTKVDAAAGFDGLDAEGQAEMRLACAGWTDQMDGFGAIDELQPGKRHDAVPVERRLEREVEPGERLDRGQARHLQSHFDTPVLTQRDLLGEQDIDSLERGRLATLDAAQRDV